MRGEAEYQVPKWAERIANSPKTKCRVFFCAVQNLYLMETEGIFAPERDLFL